MKDKPERPRKARDRLRDGASTRAKRDNNNKPIPAARTAARTAADPRTIEVAAELKSLGIRAGYAVVATHGLGWARALALLLWAKKRWQRSVRRLGRYFVGNPHEVVWETGYTPELLAEMEDERWSRLLGRFKYAITYW